MLEQAFCFPVACSMFVYELFYNRNRQESHWANRSRFHMMSLVEFLQASSISWDFHTRHAPSTNLANDVFGRSRNPGMGTYLLRNVSGHRILLQYLACLTISLPRQPLSNVFSKYPIHRHTRSSNVCNDIQSLFFTCSMISQPGFILCPMISQTRNPHIYSLHVQ